jgi:hypothetical protein
MNLFVAMVVLGRAELPALLPLRAALAGRDDSKISPRDGAVSFTSEGIQINCGLVEAPIPKEELLPMLRTSPYWQGDDALIMEHKAHLIVAASGEAEPKRLALILTRSVAAILATTDTSIAVYWGAGTVITQKDAFCHFAKSATLDQLPLYSWIDFRCYPDGSGYGLFTHGMKSLGFMEIKIPHSSGSAEDTVGLAFNIAHYLLDHGPIIKNGDTIGMSADQKLKITHVKSAHSRDENVYNLEVG